MKTFGLENGDLVIVNNDLSLIDGIEEVDEIRQCLAISMGTRLGEWFLNLNVGMDFDLFLEKPTDEEIQAEIMRIIAQEERIEMIDSVNINQDRVNRMLTVSYVVQLNNGEILEEKGVSLGGFN